MGSYGEGNRDIQLLVSSLTSRHSFEYLRLDCKMVLKRILKKCFVCEVVDCIYLVKNMEDF